METMVKEKSINSNYGMMSERIFIDIPKTDMVFFKFFADKMGWTLNSRKALWDEYIIGAPENIDLSEEEIMEEVRAVRYGKV